MRLKICFSDAGITVRIRFVVGLLAATLSFMACGESGRKTIHWKQEVQLQDGRVIAVERESKQTGILFPENTINEYEQTLTFATLDSHEKIVWTIPDGLMPRMLDFDNARPYIVFRTGSVADYNTWGCPNPPWLVFSYENHQWKQLPAAELPDRFTTPNLLDSAHSADKLTEDGLVTVDEMHSFLKASQFSTRRTISREKIKPVAEGCHPSNLTKQGRQSEITE